MLPVVWSSQMSEQFSLLQHEQTGWCELFSLVAHTLITQAHTASNLSATTQEWR